MPQIIRIFILKTTLSLCLSQNERARPPILKNGDQSMYSIFLSLVLGCNSTDRTAQDFEKWLQKPRKQDVGLVRSVNELSLFHGDPQTFAKEHKVWIMEEGPKSAEVYEFFQIPLVYVQPEGIYLLEKQKRNPLSFSPLIKLDQGKITNLTKAEKVLQRYFEQRAKKQSDFQDAQIEVIKNRDKLEDEAEENTENAIQILSSVLRYPKDQSFGDQYLIIATEDSIPSSTISLLLKQSWKNNIQPVFLLGTQDCLEHNTDKNDCRQPDTVKGATQKLNLQKNDALVYLEVTEQDTPHRIFISDTGLHLAKGSVTPQSKKAQELSLWTNIQKTSVYNRQSSLGGRGFGFVMSSLGNNDISVQIQNDLQNRVCSDLLFQAYNDWLSTHDSSSPIHIPAVQKTSYDGFLEELIYAPLHIKCPERCQTPDDYDWNALTQALYRSESSYIQLQTQHDTPISIPLRLIQEAHRVPKSDNWRLFSFDITPSPEDFNINSEMQAAIAKKQKEKETYDQAFSLFQEECTNEKLPERFVTSITNPFQSLWGSLNGLGGLGGTPSSSSTTKTGTVTFKTPRVKGGLSRKNVEKIVKRKQGTKFRFCYDRTLKKEPALKGNMTVKFDIVRGKVKNIQFLSVPSEALKKCIQRKLKKFRFPSTSKETSVRYPISFESK